MLLTTTTFVCTDETGPKFWLAHSLGETLTPQQYGYVTPNFQVSTGQMFLEVYDTEQQLADRVDSLTSTPGFYWECQNRIPYPPNPNEWQCDETPAP